MRWVAPTEKDDANRVRLAIEDALDEGLPRAYTKELYAAKCSTLFEHVFESYQGEGRSAFTEPA